MPAGKLRQLQHFPWHNHRPLALYPYHQLFSSIGVYVLYFGYYNVIYKSKNIKEVYQYE